VLCPSLILPFPIITLQLTAAGHASPVLAIGGIVSFATVAWAGSAPAGVSGVRGTARPRMARGGLAVAAALMMQSLLATSLPGASDHFPWFVALAAAVVTALATDPVGRRHHRRPRREDGRADPPVLVAAGLVATGLFALSPLLQLRALWTAVGALMAARAKIVLGVSSGTLSAAWSSTAAVGAESAALCWGLSLPTTLLGVCGNAMCLPRARHDGRTEIDASSSLASPSRPPDALWTFGSAWGTASGATAAALAASGRVVAGDGGGATLGSYHAASVGAVGTAVALAAVVGFLVWAAEREARWRRHQVQAKTGRLLKCEN